MIHNFKTKTKIMSFRALKKVDEDLTRHKEKFDAKKIKLVGFISFLMGFAQAFFVYVMSSYFKLSSGMENLGLFYVVAYVVTLIILLNFHKIVRKWGKSTVFYFSLVFKIAVISFLMNINPSYWGVGLVMLYIIFGNLEWVSLDIIIESFSADKMSGRIRGRHLTILNAGFLVGPFLSTMILEKFNFQLVFLLLFVFNCLILLISILGFRKVNHKFDLDLSVTDVIKKIWQRKNILRIYYISFVLEFFYALLVIFVPIYLLDLGIDWKGIGIIFTVMLLPFVFLQYPMGFLADKRWGEKEFIIVSIIFMFLSTSVVYFISSASIALWSIVLLSTRIGAAMLEVLRDSYFYKRIDGHDVDLINFFRTAMPMGYILASSISVLLLLFFPVKSVFLAASLVVFSALWPAIFLVDNKCEKELRRNC